MNQKQAFVQGYLNKYYPMYKEVEQLRQRIELLNDDLNKCVGNYEVSDYKSYPDPKAHREELLAKVGDMNTIFEKKVLDLKSMDEEILLVIDQLEDTPAKTVLIARYINRKPWKQIQKEVKYEKAQTHRYHLMGLDEAYPIIAKMKKDR